MAKGNQVILTHTDPSWSTGSNRHIFQSEGEFELTWLDSREMTIQPLATDSGHSGLKITIKKAKQKERNKG